MSCFLEVCAEVYKTHRIDIQQSHNRNALSQMILLFDLGSRYLGDHLLQI